MGKKQVWFIFTHLTQYGIASQKQAILSRKSPKLDRLANKQTYENVGLRFRFTQPKINYN
jgi:hypothetical protein